LGTRVRELREREDALVAISRRGDDLWHLSARVVVLATGFGSPLVRRWFGDPPGRVCGAQVELPVRGLRETEIFIGANVAPGSFGWAVPVHGASTGVMPSAAPVMARIGVLAYDAPRRRLLNLLQGPFLRNRLPSLPDPADGACGPSGACAPVSAADAEPAGFRVSPLPLGALARTWRPRLLVVGEAAGQVKPTTGGGIYYSLLGAEAAAEAITGAFTSGDFGEHGLGRYESLWRSRLEREIDTGLLVRRLALKVSDTALASLLRLARYDGLHAILHSAARFDWHADLVSKVLAHRAVKKWLPELANGQS